MTSPTLATNSLALLKPLAISTWGKSDVHSIGIPFNQVVGGDPLAEGAVAFQIRSILNGLVKERFKVVDTPQLPSVMQQEGF